MAQTIVPQTVMPQDNSQIQIIQAVPQPNPIAKHAKVFRGLGIAQIVLGGLCIILGITLIIVGTSGPYYLNFFSLIASGIWGGAFTVIAGGLGVATGKNSTPCIVIAGLVMSIVSALGQINVFAFAIIGTILGEIVGIVLNSILAAIGFSALVVSIVHSSYCCVGLNCCFGNNAPTQLIYTNQIPPNYVASGQQYHQPQVVYQQQPFQQPQPIMALNQQPFQQQQQPLMASDQQVFQQPEQPFTEPNQAPPSEQKEKI